MQSLLTKVVVSVAVSVAVTAAINYVNKRTGNGHIKSTFLYIKL
ncbi:hypothetical protein ACSA002_1260 [Salmonella phage vB_SalM_SA002]|nr:hypothetical protein ACSA002_1260 [Salmonella phage vB_SalM_SA002]